MARRANTRASREHTAATDDTRAHDASYRQLFAHKVTAQALIEGFAPKTLVAQLNLAKMQRVPVTFLSESLARREGDMLWKIPRKDRRNAAIYVYVLMEFQSYVDPTMAVRMLVYVGLLYQYLLKERPTLSRRGLPQVFPMVLYNGERPWSAKCSVQELIAISPNSALLPFQPAMKYYLLDERRVALPGEASLPGLLFEFERAKTPAQLAPLVARFSALLAQPAYRGLKRDALAWLVSLLVAHDAPLEPEQVQSITEVHRMLAKNLDRWVEKIHKKGREEGREEGLHASLSLLLAKRFGEDDTRHERLSALSHEQLERALERILSAPDEEAVFAS